MFYILLISFIKIMQKYFQFYSFISRKQYNISNKKNFLSLCASSFSLLVSLKYLNMSGNFCVILIKNFNSFTELSCVAIFYNYIVYRFVCRFRWFSEIKLNCYFAQKRILLRNELSEMRSRSARSGTARYSVPEAKREGEGKF